MGIITPQKTVFINISSRRAASKLNFIIAALSLPESPPLVFNDLTGVRKRSCDATTVETGANAASVIERPEDKG